MRLVGMMTEEGQARRFVDYLLTRQIPAEIRPSSGGWAIWVVREDQLPQSRGEYEEFLAAPDDPRFTEVARSASALRKEAVRIDREHRQNTTDLRDRIDRIIPSRCPVVFLLILGSVLVALGTNFGSDERRLDPFFFSPAFRRQMLVERADGRVEVETIERSSGLGPLKRGELWRLFTPMFIHYDWRHLIFNMIALYGFGGLIELRKGSWVLLGLVFSAAPVSFFGQYLWDVRQLGPEQVSLPGGMSGVVYALFGYAWMTGEYEPESGLRLSNMTIVSMLLWLVWCFTGALGSIANAAHFCGLLFGMLAGLTLHLIDMGQERGADSGP
jgi:GlpG protein